MAPGKRRSYIRLIDMNLEEFLMKKLLIVVLAAFTVASSAYAVDDPGKHDKEQISKNFKKAGYSPYAGRDFATQVYFGDTHLHTSSSGDAFGFGNKVNDEDALRFARGQEVTSPGGIRASPIWYTPN